MRLFTEDELRKECIDFFKWNAREVGAYINYLVGYSDTDGFDEDDYSSKELESVEELVAYQASAATTINELETEIQILKKFLGSID